MLKLVLEILEKNNLKYGDIAIRRWGNRPQILMGDLFLSVLQNDRAWESLDISRSTFDRKMKKEVKDIRIKLAKFKAMQNTRLPKMGEWEKRGI